MKIKTINKITEYYNENFWNIKKICFCFYLLTIKSNNCY